VTATRRRAQPQNPPADKLGCSCRAVLVHVAVVVVGVLGLLFAFVHHRGLSGALMYQSDSRKSRTPHQNASYRRVGSPPPPRHVNRCDDTPRTPAAASVSTSEPIAMRYETPPAVDQGAPRRVVLVSVSVVVTAVLVLVCRVLHDGPLVVQVYSQAWNVTRAIADGGPVSRAASI
jgi:hypothetical protein